MIRIALRPLIFLGISLFPIAPAAAAALDCRLSAQSVPACGRIEISFPDTFHFDNPYDPTQAVVDAAFFSPSGREIVMPGFYYQDFERQGDQIVKRGEGEWRVRFTPTEPGEWKVTVRVGATDKLASELAFRVEPAKARGFLRRSTANPLALEFEDGEPLIAIGSNVFPQTKIGQPVGPERALNVIRYLERTAAAGGTFCRFRMDSWFLPLELPRDEASGYEGVGRFNAQAAWEIDRIVEAAERLGITLMLCIENANGTVNGPKTKDRERFNQYAKANGGPLEDMKDFWTNAEAKRLFLRKMRYSVARWGYSPAIGVWEFFNEVSLRAADPKVIADWHATMAKEWRAMDPYKRPIATSALGGPMGTEEWKALFAAPDIDLFQYHTYSFTDMAGGLGGSNLRLLTQIDKPLVVGEFGTDKKLRESQPKGKGSDPQIDPAGLHMHNGIWASALTGAAGALPWFITNYIDPLNLYPVYTGLSRFRADWKINEGPWRPVEASAADVVKGSVAPRDLVVPTQDALQRPEADTYRIGRDGSLGGADSINGFLFGIGAHKDMRRPPTFEVDYPKAGQFIVTVHYVVGKSQSTTPVTIELDGKEAARKAFPLGEGQGKKAEHIPEYDNWRVTYEEEIAIDVPAGPHKIKVDAQGTDRASVGYRLTNYVNTPPVTYRVFAMGYKDSVRFWIQNKENTYYNHFQGKPPTDAPKAEVRVAVEQPGRYEAEWWDTVKGEAIRKEAAEAKENSVTLAFPGTLSDEACKLRRARP
ncbi:MAG: DUF5060 domain-containing protein [Candidatus Sumerlaeota bacterium]|nr:DUF5060 domain-containing protein [Candidatus Sumerlaeota bacterium]